MGEDGGGRVADTNFLSPSLKRLALILLLMYQRAGYRTARRGSQMSQIYTVDTL